jgi:hypothetical protein
VGMKTGSLTSFQDNSVADSEMNSMVNVNWQESIKTSLICPHSVYGRFDSGGCWCPYSQYPRRSRSLIGGGDIERRTVSEADGWDSQADGYGRQMDTLRSDQWMDGVCQINGQISISGKHETQRQMGRQQRCKNGDHELQCSSRCIYWWR